MADIRTLFDGLQQQLFAALKSNRTILEHPVAKGDASEADWLAVLDRLPNRYSANRAFVIDVDGNRSDCIDIVIFDRQYTPLLFEHRGQMFIPAESVYAVMEVKQDLNRDHVLYAAEKAASVRSLRRTSAPIPHAGGVYDPKKPGPILAGILALDSSWTPPFGTSFRQALEDCSTTGRLDIGCCLNAGAFEVRRAPSRLDLETSSRDKALITFFLTLVRRLQELATVPMMDIAEWARQL